MLFRSVITGRRAPVFPPAPILVGAALTRLFAGWWSRWRESRVAAGRRRLGPAAAPGGLRSGAAGGTGGVHGRGKAAGPVCRSWAVRLCSGSLLVSVAPPRNG